MISTRDAMVSRAADALLIATCLALIGVLWLRYRPNEVVGAAEVTSGVGVAFGDTSIERSAKTRILVYAQSSCRFCTASIPFYRTLEDASRRSGRFELVFVTTDQEHLFRAYAVSNGIRNPTVRTRAAFEGIRGTPTLIVVDGQRSVLGIWVGRLSALRESRVLALTGGRGPS
jgi:hypothetical protein